MLSLNSNSPLEPLKSISAFDIYDPDSTNDQNDKNSTPDLHIAQDQLPSDVACKYLYSYLSSHKNPCALPTEELKYLLTPDTKPKSKWANDDYVGQEELYEACERALNDLRNYEQAKHFLHKVSTRDAPDYYEVIKKPMDMGTMRRKLGQFQYKSKAEFFEDLYLIYSNCLHYNQIPLDNPYRLAALYLKEKTDELLLQVPDIVIRHKSEMTTSVQKPKLASLIVETKFGLTQAIPPTASQNYDNFPEIHQPERTFKMPSDPQRLYTESFYHSFDLPSMSQFKRRKKSKIDDHVDQNIETLHKIRDIHERIALLKEEGCVKTAELYKPARPMHFGASMYYNPNLDVHTAHSWLQRSICKLLLHSGFEGCRESTLNIVTDIAIQGLHNLGRTLKSYSDRCHNHMNSEEMIHHVLEENGLSVLSLDSYLHNDIIKYTKKCSDLHARLELKFKELLMEGEESELEGLDDFPMEDKDDAFAGGNFLTSILGEDFYGFKNMGLGALSVPSKLWYKDKERPGYFKRITHAKSEQQSSDRPLQYPPPPPFPSLTSIEPVIGLLKPFFKKKLSSLSSSQQGLRDDEEVLPPKIRSQRLKERDARVKSVHKKKAMEASMIAGGNNSKKKKKLEMNGSSVNTANNSPIMSEKMLSVNGVVENG